MKSNSYTPKKKDKIIGNPKTCKRWLVWFRKSIRKDSDKLFECCGSNSWYPIRQSISIANIDANIKESNAYKYKPKGAIAYRIWEGSILNGKFITEVKFVD